MKKRGMGESSRNLRLLAAFACLFLLLGGCAPAQQAMAPARMVFTTPMPSATPTPAPTSTPSPTPAPTPTPEPTPVYRTVAAVGDIMMMQSQVRGGWRDSLGTYDFTSSFSAMEPLFQRADLLIGNLETPLAGEENGGYSGPAAEAPTPAPDGTVPERELQTFNAPDALAHSLKAVGFGAITTANNHVLDRGAQGALRTVEVLRAAGLLQTGSWLSEADRGAPCIADLDGIKVGLVAWTFSVNGYEGTMSGDQRAWMVGRTRDEERMAEDIRLSREAGAEFIIALPHWDAEFQNEPSSSTRRQAAWLLENGADAVIGSHPHVVQPIEYLTVERPGGPYTGLVAFSMGNFISNMAPSPRDYGLYLELVLEKSPEGSVSLFSASYLPTLCIKEKVEGRTLHQVLPAWTGSEGELGEAHEHVTRVCGSAVPVMEPPEPSGFPTGGES